MWFVFFIEVKYVRYKNQSLWKQLLLKLVIDKMHVQFTKYYWLSYFDSANNKIYFCYYLLFTYYLLCVEINCVKNRNIFFWRMKITYINATWNMLKFYFEIPKLFKNILCMFCLYILHYAYPWWVTVTVPPPLRLVLLSTEFKKFNI